LGGVFFLNLRFLVALRSTLGWSLATVGRRHPLHVSAVLDVGETSQHKEQVAETI
jgi:hypothetical protein